jgi:hypothetical protein
MANTLLSLNMITREAVRLWKNSNAFIQNIDTQYDDQFAKEGAKIGTSLRIRLPNQYKVRTGPAVDVQDTVETNTTLTLATQKGVDVSFSSVERTMTLDDYSDRILSPMISYLAANVAADIMSGVEPGISNLQANVDSSNNVITPNAQTWLNAGAILDQNSAPMTQRYAILDPITMARTVGSLAGLFNPSKNIGEQYRTGDMKEALGFDWYKDQTVIKHTTANFGGTRTVNGAGQTGNAITINASMTGGLNIGDIITFAGVNGVNRLTRQTTGQLQQFVVTANVAAGALSIPIYPAMIANTGVNSAYQTVTASPANGAAVALVLNASSIYRKNFVYCPEAVTMATADLIMPTKSVEEAEREVFDGISMRMLTGYLTGTDQMITRLDVLYGWLWLRPEWAVAVPDAI